MTGLASSPRADVAPAPCPRGRPAAYNHQQILVMGLQNLDRPTPHVRRGHGLTTGSTQVVAFGPRSLTPARNPNQKKYANAVDRHACARPDWQPRSVLPSRGASQ